MNFVENDFVFDRIFVNFYPDSPHFEQQLRQFDLSIAFFIERGDNLNIVIDNDLN